MRYHPRVDSTKSKKPGTKKGADERHYHLRLSPELDEMVKRYTEKKRHNREVEAIRQMIRQQCELEGLAA